MTTAQTIKAFVDQLIEHSSAEEMDRIFLTNQVLRIINLDEYVYQDEINDKTLLELMDDLIQIGLENRKVGTTNADIIGSELMGLFLPRPSEFNRLFWEHYHHSPATATHYFYHAARLVNYIKTREISKNIEFPYQGKYGELKITINLSKPEKDPKEIAAAQKVKQSSYPKCQLCLENEGYQGCLNYPARTNHRVVRLSLGGEEWGFQYSPYAYFPEHAIVFAREHRPMKVSSENVRHLFEFVELFPHYFIGSNADLPIVGGSILTHDHFQAGNYEMPMAKASIEQEIKIPGVSLATAGIVKWPMSVIRIGDDNIENLVRASDVIMRSWQHYNDVSQNIIAYSDDGIQHHTVTPIARKRGNQFELDIVLRDNNTSEIFPDGIFHPHQDVQHIKKENIGLIEVMGLAILPPRLQSEMKVVENYLLGDDVKVASMHQAWAQKIKDKYPEINSNNVNQIIHQEIGQVFERVLEDAGVFKQSEEGKVAFEKFITHLKA